MRIIAALAALILPMSFITPVAFAQYYPSSAQALNVNVTVTSFSPSTGTPDQYGNVVATASTDGSAQGAPITGTFHADETRYLANGLAGPLQGTFTIDDGAGNTVTGSYSGQFSVGASGSMAQAQYVITGGTGAYAGATGAGMLTEQIDGAGSVPTLTLAGSVASQSVSVAVAPPILAAPSNTASGPTFYAPPGVGSSQSYSDPNTGIYYEVTPCTSVPGYSVTPSFGSVAPQAASSVSTGATWGITPRAGGPAC